MLRDEPLSSEIPEFKPSTYHQEQEAEATEQLVEMATGSNAELQAKWRSECAEQIERAKRGIEERKEQKARYEKMLADAKRFVAPTEKHKEFAKFICEQLEESIRFDCGTDFYDEQLQVKPFSEWKRERIADLESSIQYHKNGWAEEVARVNQRNEWVKQLREAIAKVEPVVAAI